MDAFSVAGVGMQDDLQRMNSISQNLANVTTTAYKREIAVSRPFFDHVDQLRGAGNIGSNPARASAPITDMTHGILRHTGNPLDIAIEGDGYFEVSTEKGLLYTRRGSLHIDTRGRLVTEDGYALMGVSGELVISGTTAQIDRNGEVREGDRVMGQIKLVRFSNPQALASIANGMFSQGSARLADAGADGNIRAGYLENSNVNSPQEMVRLTETVRHFEAMQKIMQGYDDAFEKAMHKLGDF